MRRKKKRLLIMLGFFAFSLLLSLVLVITTWRWQDALQHEQAQRAALEQARREAAEQAQRAALEQARREAAEQAQREALERTIIPEFPWPPPTASASLVLPNPLVRGQWRLHGKAYPLRTGRYLYYYYDNEELSAWTDVSPHVSPHCPKQCGEVASRQHVEEFTSRYLIRLWNSGGPRLIHVNATLTNALAAAGYYEASYYSVPDGFAVVTRLEQINSDGTPKPSPTRWETETRRLEKFSLAEYLRALFLAKPGFYRVIVFVVTPHPFTQSQEVVTRKEAISWLRFGANVLPLELSLRPYSAAFTCTALIYEFEKADVQAEATIKVPGRLAAQIHMEKSGIGVALQ